MDMPKGGVRETKVLRQGSPLFVFFFTIVADVLSRVTYHFILQCFPFCLSLVHL